MIFMLVTLLLLLIYKIEKRVRTLMRCNLLHYFWILIFAITHTQKTRSRAHTHTHTPPHIMLSSDQDPSNSNSLWYRSITIYMWKVYDSNTPFPIRCQNNTVFWCVFSPQILCKTHKSFHSQKLRKPWPGRPLRNIQIQSGLPSSHPSTLLVGLWIAFWGETFHSFDIHVSRSVPCECFQVIWWC